MLSNRFLRYPILLLWTAVTAAQAGNGKLQIHHLDMGQGDAAVLISPNGQVVLLDREGYGGQEGMRCPNRIPQAAWCPEDRLHLCESSSYRSHRRRSAVLEKFPLVTAAYDRAKTYESGCFTRYAAAVSSKRKAAQPGKVVELDDGPQRVTLTVLSLNGTYTGGQVATENENDLSVSVLVSFGGFREEIGGDLSGEHTSTYEDIESGVAPSVGSIDVYKVHHHCSSYSSNGLWLKTTAPTVAIISTGDGNSYRHPTEDCLSRLHKAEISKVYWTEHGAGAEPKSMTSSPAMSLSKWNPTPHHIS